MRQTARFQQFNPSQRHALDAGRNLVIRANAGSGKTSVLIERIVQILAGSFASSSPLSITDIAAITFTRKAAAEIQERLHKAFEEEQAGAVNAAEKSLWGNAGKDLSRAMIGTIDSLCGRILREFHWELHGTQHIDVDYQPLDAYDQQVLQQEAIDRVINRAGAVAESEAQRAALEWWGHREGYGELTRRLLELLNHSVEPERIVAAHRAKASVEERRKRIWQDAPAVRLLRETRDHLQSVLQEIVEILEREPRGKVLTELQENSSTLIRMLASGDEGMPVFSLLSEMLLKQDGDPRKLGNFKIVASQMTGMQEAWSEPLLMVPDLDGEAHAMLGADHLATLLEPVHAEYMALCSQANRFDFLTVARRTRDLLRSSRRARSALRERYRYVMVDEFQDTNPLQWEIISFIVGAGPDGLLDRDRLCIVGDPQQSIFRFRQADVRVFQQAHEKIVASNRHHDLNEKPMAFDAETGARRSTREEREGFVALAENYRSLSPLPLLLMDQVFRLTFSPEINGLNPDIDTFEIRYQPLAAGRNEACGEVRYVYVESDQEESEETDSDEDSDEVAPEPDLVAAQVEAVAGELAGLWGKPRLADAGNALRWSDMAILLPTRTETLSSLEKALRRRSIPFVVSGGIGFWQRQEIRDLVALASWLADPGDELSLFVILRSPIVLLSDSEIYFLSQLGRGSLWRGLQNVLSSTGDALPDRSGQAKLSRRPEPAGLDEALLQTWQQFDSGRRVVLREAAIRLGRWRERTDRMGHADLLQRPLEESGAYAHYAVLPEGEQILANLRQFFDIVRAEEARSAPGLGHLARRLRLHVEDFEKEGQANLSSGEDAVQIMTVHAAKGLEFPVVAVLKMESAVQRPGGPNLMVQEEEHETEEAGTIFVSVRHPSHPLRSFTCLGLRRLRDLDRRQQVAEKRRLFYVAGTRASERLILAGRAVKKKNLPSWQRWFEDGLELTDQDRQAGFWEHPQHGWRVQIVASSPTQATAGSILAETAPPRVDLDPIVEASQKRLMAATEAAALRQTLHGELPLWDLLRRQRSKSGPGSGAGGPFPTPAPLDRGALVGQLVHRLMMFNVLSLPTADFEQRLSVLAGAVFEKRAITEDDELVESDAAELEAITAAARRIFARLKQSDPAAQAICGLMRAPGKVEVPFVLALDRWVIRGRFDKLIQVDSGPGFTLVDWKTGQGSRQGAADRYGPQMQLYALALARSGQAARVNGGVLVQLVLLESAEILSLRFNDEALRAFSSELEDDLRKMGA